jgi:hypothetical protein
MQKNHPLGNEGDMKTFKIKTNLEKFPLSDIPLKNG